MDYSRLWFLYHREMCIILYRKLSSLPEGSLKIALTVPLTSRFRLFFLSRYLDFAPFYTRVPKTYYTLKELSLCHKLWFSNPYIIETNLDILN